MWRSRELFRLEYDKLDGGYEARHGWTFQDALVLPLNAGGLALGVTETSGVLGMVGTAALGGLLVLRAAQLAARRPTLRVDREGVTLQPGWPGARGRPVPWSDLAAIYVWRRGWGGIFTWYVGLHRREDAGEPEKIRRQLWSVSVPAGVPRQVSYHARRAIGWELDRVRLAEAVARFGRGVEVVQVD